MTASGPTKSSPPLSPPSNDGLSEQLDSMTNSELFSFMSLRRSEFSNIAAILKKREESAKAEALKDFSATVTELQDKNGSLEKELLSLRNHEADIQKLIQVTSNQTHLHELLKREIMQFEKKKNDCARLEGELESIKKDCTALRESEKLAQEKINDLIKESASRRAEDELINALKQKYLEIVKNETDLTWGLISCRTYCSNLKMGFTCLKSAYSALEVYEGNTSKRSKLLEEVQLKLEEARNKRIVEFEIWKDNSIQTWIQQFLDNNPCLVEEVKPPTTRKKRTAKFDSSRKRKFGSNI